MICDIEQLDPDEQDDHELVMRAMRAGRAEQRYLIWKADPPAITRIARVARAELARREALSYDPKPPHAHCPYECEHPQPMLLADGRELCVRCWHVNGVETEMVACTPERCS